MGRIPHTGIMREEGQNRARQGLIREGSRSNFSQVGKPPYHIDTREGIYCNASRLGQAAGRRLFWRRGTTRRGGLGSMRACDFASDISDASVIGRFPRDALYQIRQCKRVGSERGSKFDIARRNSAQSVSGSRKRIVAQSAVARPVRKSDPRRPAPPPNPAAASNRIHPCVPDFATSYIRPDYARLMIRPAPRLTEKASAKDVGAIALCVRPGQSGAACVARARRLLAGYRSGAVPASRRCLSAPEAGGLPRKGDTARYIRAHPPHNLNGRVDSPYYADAQLLIVIARRIPEALARIADVIPIAAPQPRGPFWRI